MNRVAITGIGFVNSLGSSKQSVWEKLCKGKSGVRSITQYDPSALKTQIAGEVTELDVRSFLSKPRSMRLMNKGSKLAIAAAAQSLQDSAVNWGSVSATNVAVYFASENQISGTERIFPAIRNSRLNPTTIDYRTLGKEAMKLYPLYFVEGLPAAALYFISEQFGFTGASAFYSGAADTGLSTVGAAFRAIKSGESSYAVAGAFDDAAAWWSMIRMEPQNVLAPADKSKLDSYQPFTNNATGRIIGDGGCALVLENMEIAKSRGAHIYAEVLGFGSGSETLADDNDKSQPIRRSVRSALREAGCYGSDVELVMAHGAAVPLTDEAESAAIEACCERPIVTCVHPATGHQLSAAGTFNVAIAALSLCNSLVPPTLVDEEELAPYAPLNLLTRVKHHTVQVALALGNGLEGQSSALVLRSV